MTAKKRAKLEVSDWELLQGLQEDLASNLKSKDLGKKLSDLLKIVELKYKIKDESQREKIFWEMVEDLRMEVLGEPKSRRHEELEVLNHEGTKSSKSTKKKQKNKISEKNSSPDETEKPDMSRRE